MARRAMAYEPSPRTASFVAAIGAVDRDLHVDVVRAGEPRGRGRGDRRAVRRELHADAVADGVVDEVVEVAPDRRLAAADVHVEDLHVAQLVDDGHGLGGRELVRVAPSRRGQAVDARRGCSRRSAPT